MTYSRSPGAAANFAVRCGTRWSAFTDPASGHTLAGDFAALSSQVRQPGFNPLTTPVTPLPFFENQMGGTTFCQGFDLNCTQFLYDQDSGQVTRGDLGDATQLLQEFPVFFGAPGFVGGVGLKPLSVLPPTLTSATRALPTTTACWSPCTRSCRVGCSFDLQLTPTRIRLITARRSRITSLAEPASPAAFFATPSTCGPAGVTPTSTQLT